MGSAGLSYLLQLFFTGLALVLCLLSIATSRSRRSTHRSYLAWSIGLMLATILALAVERLFFSDALTMFDDWTPFALPAVTVLICLVPIVRWMQSSRIRKNAQRYRVGSNLR